MFWQALWLYLGFSTLAIASVWLIAGCANLNTTVRYCDKKGENCISCEVTHNEPQPETIETHDRILFLAKPAKEGQ